MRVAIIVSVIVGVVCGATLSAWPSERLAREVEPVEAPRAARPPVAVSTVAERTETARVPQVIAARPRADQMELRAGTPSGSEPVPEQRATTLRAASDRAELSVPVDPDAPPDSYARTESRGPQ